MKTLTDNERLGSRYHKICRNYIQALVASKTGSEKAKKKIAKSTSKTRINQSTDE